MGFNYKLVHIYSDLNQNLIFIPTGESKKWGGTLAIDSVTELKHPYSDEQLEEALNSSLDRCYSLKPDESLKESALEKYLGVKGFSKACKGKKLVLFEWLAKEGFSFTPTDKVKGEGYNHLSEQKISFGKNVNKGDLANAVKKAIELSKTY
jgi:hypothetical protein